MNRTVLIAGGGTGGHIFPGLAVASELAGMGCTVHWLGAKKGLESELVGRRNIPVTLVRIEGIRGRGAAAAIRAATSMPEAVRTAIRLILQTRPVAVLGVGGYASAAGVLAAGMLGVPWVLQEQNAVPGWTNRSLAPWADLICCGFEEAVRAFPSLPAEWSGNPVRSEFFQVGPLVPHDPHTVLVLGGSQGSLFLNRTLPLALAHVIRGGRRLAIRHQAGVRWEAVVRTAYRDLGVEAEVAAFLPEPWKALEAADLVVARAGALTVSELAAAGRASLLIPFAAAAGNHQEYNARSLERAGGARVLTESEANASRVAGEIEDLLADPAALATMATQARSLALPGAARRIARRLLEVGGAA